MINMNFKNRVSSLISNIVFIFYLKLHKVYRIIQDLKLCINYKFRRVLRISFFLFLVFVLRLGYRPMLQPPWICPSKPGFTAASYSAIQCRAA